MKESLESEHGEVVRDKEGLEREKEESPSSSREAAGAHMPFFESVSSPDSTKGDYYDVQLSARTSPSHDAKKNEELQEKKCEEPFFSCIEPFMRKFEENLHNELTYLDKLQDLCISLQEENKNLREETEHLKDFIFSAKLSQSTSERKEIAMLHNKVQALQAALRIELLKVDEYKKELDDARHVLMRRTRAKMKKGQMFEVILAQKPQEVPMASCATPFQEETNVGACPICLEEFDVASGWYTLNCKHRYHLVCLAKVMPTRTRCCVCNQELHKLLYEIFGMANRYPDDARLWDAQMGQPVDFTTEEDIRVVVNEIEESQEETDQEGEEEEDEGGEIELIPGEYVGDESSEIAGNSQADGDHDVRNASQATEGLDEEGDEGTIDEDREDDEEDEGTTDEDREDDEENSEQGSSYVTSSSEDEDDADDPDYTPSQ